MALLVNYEGAYVAPDKLWYLVDGVWKEVANIFESSIQNEIAILDQNRIKQDQTVTALTTKLETLMAQIDGTNPTIPMVDDPILIEKIVQEAEICQLQLDVAKTEQVVLTKKLFEQKAQIEYIKLVTEGEHALEKISFMVNNPADWMVIRIAPQSTLDERLEMAIQHDLPDANRIFNYGLVYYRLYKVDGEASLKINDLEYLKTQFKRRMCKTAYTNNTEPDNYILTIDSVQNVYAEVNAFVNAGAQRIEDYLKSIRDQQKYILDKIESAKTSLTTLNEIKEATNIDTLTSIATKEELKTPIGSALLEYQNVTDFNQLVSTETLVGISNGTLDANNYSGLIKLNADALALTEKINAVSEFITVNAEIQNEIVSTPESFSINTLTTKKAATANSKVLFWNSPLGATTLSSSSGIVKYQQTYSAGGTYKFKSDELVKLSTNYTAIINAILARTENVKFGVTLNPRDQVRIINVVNNNLYVYDQDDINLKTNHTAIINTKKANTATFNVGGMDTVLFNTKEQPHHSLVYVKKANTVTSESNIMKMAVIHPIINGLAYSNTEEFNPTSSTKFSSITFDYAFNIRPLHALDADPAGLTGHTFDFNAKEIPISNYFVNNDNIVTQVKELITEYTIGFNIVHIPNDLMLKNDNIIVQQVSSSKDNTLGFNIVCIPNEQFLRNDNIIEQQVSSSKENDMSSMFNAKQTNNYFNVKNGYGQSTSYTTELAISGIQVIVIPDIEELKSLYPTTVNSNLGTNRDKDGLYRRTDFYQASRIVISSQTGLTPIEFDSTDEMMNKLPDEVTRIIAQSKTKVYTPSNYKSDLLNSNQIDDTAKIVTLNNFAQITLNETNASELLNVDITASDLSNGGLWGTYPTTLITSKVHEEASGDEKLNIDYSSIPVITSQLNTGVVLD